jgi:catalase
MGRCAHWDHRVDDDHYQQPGNLFRKMSAAQKQALFDNTARAVGAAAVPIQERHIANCTKADPAYGAGVRDALTRLATVRAKATGKATEKAAE